MTNKWSDETKRVDLMADRVAFVLLTCPNCGGKLEIYDDTDRFACSFCGGEMLVQRRGGAVSLKTIESAIRRVQAGTDKTAAELGASSIAGRNSTVDASGGGDDERALINSASH